MNHRIGKRRSFGKRGRADYVVKSIVPPRYGKRGVA
nr:MAG TPA: hypothetical protein [Caudoviricetes sp.]